jgi:hypothetical protein
MALPAPHRQPEPEPTARELLADILAVLESIADRLEAGLAAPTGAVEPPSRYQRFGPLLEALAVALGGLDVPFESAEVAEHAKDDHDLELALRRCGLTTPAEIGARFRSLNGHWVGALRLLRDGDAWRLERRT